MTITLTVSTDSETAPGSDRRFWLFAAAYFVALVFYVPLVAETRVVRLPALRIFVLGMMPVAFLHLAAGVALWHFAKRRMAAITTLWGVSLCVLLALGGATRTAAFFALVLLSLLLSTAGWMLSRALFPDRNEWGVALGFGIALLSLVSTVLALFGTFRPVILGAILAPLVVYGLIVARRQWQLVTTGTRDVQWTFAHFLAVEGLFLLGSFAWVFASPPERRSDAMRVYLQYVRLVAETFTLPDLPHLWGYVIPQAGVTYAAAFHSLGGPLVARYSMLLPFLALLLIIANRTNRLGRPVAMAIALIAGATPLLLWVSASLMQDAFVYLLVMLLGVVCLEASTEKQFSFWIAIGALIGIGWTAKYTTVVFAAPLAITALVRSFREGRPWLRVLVAAATGVIASVGTAAPWLWHTYSKTGNPVMPFLLSYFPSALWPTGVPTSMLAQFDLPKTIGAWLSAPFMFTYRTERFLEGYHGNAGLAFLIFLLLGLVSLRSARGRLWFIPAIIGTLLFWLQTGYVRYWFPGVLLLAPAAIEGALILARSFRARTSLAILAIATLLLQLPIVIAGSWGDPDGLPWDYYSGKVSYEDYLRRMPAYSAYSDLRDIDGANPRVWITGLQAFGHWPMVGMEANHWEFEFHGISTPAAIEHWIENPGPDYWIVNLEASGSQAFIAKGIDKKYWRDDLVVASAGAVRVFRIPSSKRAAAAWREYSAKQQASTDVAINGSFEILTDDGLASGWTLNDDIRVLKTETAKDGSHVVSIGPTGNAVMRSEIPAGTTKLRLIQSIRAEGGSEVPVRYVMEWMEESGKPISGAVDVIQPTPEWKEYVLSSRVPPNARRVVVYLRNHFDKPGRNQFDKLELRAQP